MRSARFDSVSALLSLQKFCFMENIFVTFPLTMNETLKWLIAARLKAGGHSGGDSVALGIVSIFPQFPGTSVSASTSPDTTRR